MPPSILLEVCIDSVESGIAAERGGAQRVELCDNLIEGGTTPSVGMMRLVRRCLDIDMFVMIRPRGGDFYYSDMEYEVMKADIECAKTEGADGVVLGLLLEDGQIDEDRTSALIALAHPLKITFHRAFDVVRDPHEAMDSLIQLGVDRILTSGLEPTALEGADLLAELVKRAGDQIVIMAGGGVTERNIRKIIQQTGVKEVHSSGSVSTESRMKFRNTMVPMGRAFRASEYEWKTTSEARILSIVKQIG